MYIHYTYAALANTACKYCMQIGNEAAIQCAAELADIPKYSFHEPQKSPRYTTAFLH